MPFGSDISTTPDLDPLFGIITGPQVLAEAITRRLSTPRGALAYDPDYGIDVRAWLNEAFDAAGIERLRSAIAAECEKDERVDSVEAYVELDRQRMTMSIRVAIMTAAGPFRLVLSVDRLTVSLIQVG